MFRRIAVLVAAGLTVGLLPGAAAEASTPASTATQNTAAAVQEAAPSPDLAAACQNTFHARPTSGGLYSDPCSFNAGQTPQYSWSIGLKWHWDCTGGCHINAVLAAVTICHFADPDTSSISTNAISINAYVTKVAFLIFTDNDGPHVDGCDTLTSPFLTPVKGCGSNDGHLIGTYPGIVSLQARGRGTIYGVPGGQFPDFLRIPNGGSGYFESHESYYWVGRGGVCGNG